MTAACATVTQEVTIGWPVSQEKENNKTTVTKEVAQGEATTAGTENLATSDVVKRERRKREARELLKHLYTMMDEMKQGSVYPRDEEATSDNDYLESDDVLDFEIDYDSLDKYKGNREHHRRAKRNQNTLKEQKFATFCRKCETPKDISLVKGNKKSVREKYNRCVKQITRDSNRRDQLQRRKANTEKKLEKLGVRRRGPRTIGGADETENTQPFELREENVPKEMRDMLDFLMNLQAREVTPEDYEFLLQLDDLVQNKTVSDDCLKELVEEVVDGSREEEVCGICMESYEIGQVRKVLPCKHAFHSNCIDRWLSMQSTKCPMDGQEIEK